MIGIAIGNSVGLDIRGGLFPFNEVSPIISGLGVEYQTLTLTSVGTWDGALPISYTYQWMRNGLPILGATTTTYALDTIDAGTNITCVVTATNPIGFTAATSNTIAVISYAQWLVNNFNVYVFNQGGTVEAESCMLSTLNFLNTIP
jgi:hypothetical protein